MPRKWATGTFLWVRKEETRQRGPAEWDGDLECASHQMKKT